MKKETPELKAKIEQLFRARQERREHPVGEFDRAGRWYPSYAEHRSCCRTIRSPSHRWPYSLLIHCRTKKHVRNLILLTPSESE